MTRLLSKLQIYLIVSVVLLSAIVGCSKQADVVTVKPLQGVLDKTALLATIAADEMPVSSDPNAKHTPDSGVQVLKTGKKQPAPEFTVVIHGSGRYLAYSARVGDKVHVVHNGRPGKFYKHIYDVTLSPDGQRVAYTAKDGDRYLFVVDGKEYGLFMETGQPIFSPDSRHVAFECQIGPRWHLNVDGVVSPPTEFSYYALPAFSNDSKYILYYENGSDDQKNRIGISDLHFKNALYKPATGPVIYSKDMSQVAIIQAVEKKQKVVRFSFSNPSDSKESEFYDSIEQRRFSDDGSVLAFIAKRGDNTFLVMNGREERLAAGTYPWPFVIRPDNKGIGIFATNKDWSSTQLRQIFYDNGIKSGTYKEGSELIYSNDSLHYAFVAVKNERFIIVLDGKDGQPFDRVISPAFSPDGRFLVYRARQDGKRFMVVVDTLSGNISKKLAVHEIVYPPVFTDDGKSVAYAVQDGKTIMWMVEKL